MSEVSTRKVKKKWGKVWESTVIKRAITIDKDKMTEINKYLDGVKVTTPQEFANKMQIRVSLAREILSSLVENGSMQLTFKNGNNEIYSK